MKALTCWGYAVTTVGGTNWTYQGVGLGLGANTLSVKAVGYDGTGTGSADTTTLTVAGTVPTQIVSLSGAVVSSTSYDPTGLAIAPNTVNSSTPAAQDTSHLNVTSDATPSFYGTLSNGLNAGETLVAFDGATQLAGTATVSGLGWNYTSSTLVTGNHDISFKVISGANTGLASAALRVSVETVVANQASIVFAG